MQETHFAIPPLPLSLQKLKTQQNRDTHRWTNRIFLSIFIIFIIFTPSQKGNRGITRSKRWNARTVRGRGKLFKEGGFPHTRPPPSPPGNACLRTHPRLWSSKAKSQASNLLHRPSTLRNSPSQASLSRHHKSLQPASIVGSRSSHLGKA